MNIESNVGCSQGLSSNTSNSVKCVVVKSGRNDDGYDDDDNDDDDDDDNDNDDDDEIVSDNQFYLYSHTH